MNDRQSGSDDLGSYSVLHCLSNVLTARAHGSNSNSRYLVNITSMTTIVE